MKLWLALAVAAAGAVAVGTKQDGPKAGSDSEAAYFAAHKAHRAAVYARPRDEAKVTALRLAMGRAFDAAMADAEKTMKADLDAAEVYYREPRREVYLYALAARQILLSRERDTPTKAILGGAARVARAQGAAPRSRPIWGFATPYRALRESGLGHDEAVARMCAK